MLSWILLLAPALLFAWRGYNHGILESLSRVVGLLSGYICAILFTVPLGKVIGELSGLPGLLPYMAASAIFLFGASTLISLLFDVIERHWPDHLHSDHVGSFSGGLFGLCIGAFIGILLIWCVGLGRGFIQQAPHSHTQIDMISQRLAGKVISLTLERFDPPQALKEASSAFLQSPEDTVTRIRRISQRKHLQALIGNKANHAILDSGDLERLQQLASFQKLVTDEDMQHLLNITGQPHQHNERLARGLSDMWMRFQDLKQDPEFIALVNNPQFQQELKSANPIALVSSPELKRFTELMLNANTTERDESEANTDDPQPHT